MKTRTLMRLFLVNMPENVIGMESSFTEFDGNVTTVLSFGVEIPEDDDEIYEVTNITFNADSEATTL